MVEGCKKLLIVHFINLARQLYLNDIQQCQQGSTLPIVPTRVVIVTPLSPVMECHNHPGKKIAAYLPTENSRVSFLIEAAFHDFLDLEVVGCHFCRCSHADICYERESVCECVRGVRGHRERERDKKRRRQRVRVDQCL